MSKIKTLAEISECCAVCAFIGTGGYGCHINGELDNDIGNWCEQFEPFKLIARIGIEFVKPKLQEANSDKG